MLLHQLYLCNYYLLSRYFIRGKNARPAEDDYVVSMSRNHKLKKYDEYLKTFQHKKALDSVLKVHSFIQYNSEILM